MAFRVNKKLIPGYWWKTEVFKARIDNHALKIPDYGGAKSMLM